MDSSAPIQPFWNRIPKLFLYGVRTEPLILAVLLFGASWLLGGGLFDLVLALVVLKYSMAVLERTAEGYLSPPKLSYEVLVANYELPLKLYFLILVWFVIFGVVAASIGPAAAFILFYAGILLFPAVVIALVMTEDFGYAFNPLNAWAMAQRIGWPYFIMFGFLFLFSITEQTVQALFLKKIGSDFLEPMWFGIDTIFSIITFHLMGYVILQYHEKLGGAKPEAIAIENAEAPVSTSPLLERFIEEGNIPAATEEFFGLVRKHPEDMSLQRRLYTYLISTDQTDRLKKYLPSYFSALIDADAIGDATKLYLDSVQRGQPFIPRRPSDFLPLMRELRRRRMGKEAAKIANGFHKRFPDSPEIPRVYFEMAQVFSDDLQRDDLAEKTLLYLLKRFPRDPLIPKVKEYLSFIQQLGERQTGA